ncbi:MAG: GntR family transcriptional regulator [Anaerotruncus sp.]|nr:GntR family transcriptional regulator [Anaerotruncus sp.]
MEKIVKKSAYLCARDRIFAYIRDNELYGERLPSETEFAQALGISRNTVREAIRVLEQEGVVYSRHGVGTFVLKKHGQFTSNISAFSSISTVIRNHGYQPGTRSVTTWTFPADHEMAANLEIPEGTSVLAVERVRTADGDPVILVRDYLTEQPEMEQLYHTQKEESFLDFLKKNYRTEIGYADCVIRAAVSDTDCMKKLELQEPTALIRLSQYHYSTSGEKVFYSDSYFISSKFNFNIIRQGRK